MININMFLYVFTLVYSFVLELLTYVGNIKYYIYMESIGIIWISIWTYTIWSIRLGTF